MTSYSYVLRRAPEWRRLEDGRVELFDPRDGSWIRFVAAKAAIIEAVARGEPLADLARHVDAEPREVRARQFILHLHRMGYVELSVPIPSRLGDRFVVLRELGRGGTGIAYECRDERTGDAVVVKRAWDFLAPLVVADAATRREADVLARLDHPGIVRLRGSFVEEGRLHLVRDLAHGEDLGRHERNPMGDAREARRLVAAMADILSHVHERGLLLMDLRPSNFHVEEDGRVLLTDVGLSREKDDAAPGPASGVAGFVAPEVRRGGAASVRSDVWALGASYAFLRTGRFVTGASLAPLLSRLAPEDAALVAALAADEPEDRPVDAAAASALLKSG